MILMVTVFLLFNYNTAAVFFGTFDRAFGHVNDDRLIARILVLW